MHSPPMALFQIQHEAHTPSGQRNSEMARQEFSLGSDGQTIDSEQAGAPSVVFEGVATLDLLEAYLHRLLESPIQPGETEAVRTTITSFVGDTPSQSRVKFSILSRQCGICRGQGSETGKH
ncbi:hypothetical protein NMY22_g15483 [Coprinellus aureogranulatus]|nr:hypothetical protein NMY22_g15483 [Coprinellus aureogranulatus]